MDPREDAMLRQLSSLSADPGLKRAVQGVLDGSISLRDAIRTEAFARHFDTHDPIGWWESTSPDERARLADEGRHLLSELCPGPDG